MKLKVTVKKAPLGSQSMVGKPVSFDERGFSFGRSADNDLVLPDSNRYLSSRHGFVSVEDGVCIVHDSSSNGLFVDDATEPVGRGRAVALRSGALLSAGQYSLEIVVEA